jgi:hypothetical protein
MCHLPCFFVSFSTAGVFIHRMGALLLAEKKKTEKPEEI